MTHKLNIPLKLLSVVTLLALLQACGGDSTPVAKADNNSPESVMMAGVQAVKQNDLKSLMQASMSTVDYDKVVKEFETAKKSLSESNKAQFTQTMTMLTSEGSVDNLMVMLAPQLEQARSQLPMVLMMGKSMATQAIESSADIPTEQKENITKVANAFMDFISENDILSEEITRKAISEAVQTANDLNMNDLDEMQNMSYDEALAKAGIVIGGVKNVLNVYGISVDQLLNSVKVSDVVESGDNASLKLAYEFLGQTFVQDVTMTKKEGKWLTDK